MRFIGLNKFLSNMYPCKVIGPGNMVYPCVENAYQAYKFQEVHDHVMLSVSGNMNGYQAKGYGRRATLPDDWERMKVPLMESLLRQKFRGRLYQRLKEVHGDIIEDNTWGDTFWGRCNGIGENHLGKILMRIRDDENR